MDRFPEPRILMLLLHPLRLESSDHPVPGMHACRRHVNSWILFEFVGLWRCMKYRHPAASARVPGKPRFAWAGPQVIDMSVQQVFEQTIKDKR